MRAGRDRTTSGGVVRWNPIEVVVVPLDVAADRLRQSGQWLSIDERARATRFRFDRDRDRFVSCRGALREVIGTRIGVPPSAIPFRYGPHGKPELAGELAGTLSFNVSHSHGLALFALAANGPVGVDVERVREVADLDSVLSRFFSQRERASVFAIGRAAGAQRFFRLWTRKEAQLKGSGEGMAGPDAGETGAWHLHSFCPAPGFIAAVATRSAVRFELREWNR